MALKYKYRVKSDDDVETYKATMAKRAAGTNRFEGIFKDDYKTWRPAADNTVRILPPFWEGADHYGLDVASHYNIGPARATVLCNAVMHNAKCPICEERVKLEKLGDEDAVKELRINYQTAVWMVDMKDVAKGPMIWAFGSTIEQGIAKQAVDKQTGEVYLIDHPEEGYDISFDRAGEGINSRYSGFQIARRPTAIKQAWIDFVMENPLPDCLVERDYAEVKALFEGGADPEPDDAPKPRGSARPEPEPEPEETPQPRTRGNGRAAIAEAEEEPDEPAPRPRTRATREEPEEDEPAPRSRARARPEPEADDPPPSGGGRAQSLRERYKNNQ
jgi:hypothetical protein